MSFEKNNHLIIDMQLAGVLIFVIKSNLCHSLQAISVIAVMQVSPSLFQNSSRQNTLEG